ncbi:MAG: hypothetical protein P8J50_06230 [Acidimicrobiales bacterium]|jgi:hypothetical protein|nr:hypothetical protein [Acidimicrobiales bacterium]
MTAAPATRVGHSLGHRFFLLLRRLVAALVGVNLVVLAMLVAVTMFAGGDDLTDVALKSTEEDDGPVPISEPMTGDGAIDAPPAPAVVVPPIAAEPPPYPDPFEPTANETQPDAKRMGALVAYVITNYEANSSLTGLLATLPLGSTLMEGMVAEVDLVHHPGAWSRGAIEYVQLGGHLDGRISLIVVLRQDIGFEGSGEPQLTQTRVMEVRLARGDEGEWTFETIASAGGAHAERPADLSAVAAAVVDHERIGLPDTAAWDIYRGFIDRQLLQVMLDIAERTPYSVVVLQTGHSYNVFGTDRVSNHSVGRAVDIHMLDTELVIDSHATTSDFYALAEWIVSRHDIREFGSPWRFPDAVTHTFTNEVHHDHLHIGVHRYPASPGPVA